MPHIYFSKIDLHAFYTSLHIQNNNVSFMVLSGSLMI